MSNRAPRKMVMPRNYVLVSTYGHTVQFIKGEPVHVPSLLFTEALAVGAEFADGAGFAPEEPEAAAAPIDPQERAQRIEAVIEAIVEANDVDEFTAAGSPKAEAVSRRVGFKVSQREVAKFWQQRADRLADPNAQG